MHAVPLWLTIPTAPVPCSQQAATPLDTQRGNCGKPYGIVVRHGEVQPGAPDACVVSPARGVAHRHLRFEGAEGRRLADDKSRQKQFYQ